MTALITAIVYLLATTLVGMLMMRRSRGGDDWAIAGGRMGVLMIAVGIAGTRVGGAATYGVAGDVITGGIWNLWYGVNTFLALALVGVFFAVPYRRLRIQTVGEVFTRRFGTRRCQSLTSFCVQTEYLIVNIIEPYVIGRILAPLTGSHVGVATMIAGVIIVSYTAMGGLWGSAASNLIHCVAILYGLFAVGMAGQAHLGGWAGVVEQVDAALVSAGANPDVWWSPVGAGWGAVIAMFFATTIHTPAASVYVNFAAAAPDERATKRAFLLAGLIAMPMPMLAGWIGMETLAKYGAAAQLSSYQTLTRLAIDINPWIGGIALAAVLAAVVSSGGPILLSSATMFVRDWMPGSRSWTQDERLRAYRIVTVIYGLGAAVIAWLGPIRSILDLLLFGFAMVVPPAIAVGYVIYWKRTTERAAFWGIVLGYAGGIVSYVTTDVDPSYATTLIPLVAIPAISMLTAESAEGREAFYRALHNSQSSASDSR
jgi:SSS family solute:Na+ symporter